MTQNFVSSRHAGLIAAGVIALGAASGEAAVRTFTVDPTLSSLTLTPTTRNGATVLPTSRQINPNDPLADSFVTSYSGSLVVDVTATSVQLLAPSEIVANYDHAWRPGTDFSNYPADVNSPTGYANTFAPAAYGIITDLSSLGGVLGTTGNSPSAVRNLRVGLVDASPKPLTGVTFAEANTGTSLLYDTMLPEAPPLVYYGSGGSPPTTRVNTVSVLPTTDNALDAATIITAGGVTTIRIPFSFRISYPVNFLTLTQDFNGVIVATSPVPEPASLVFGLAFAGILLRRRVVR